MSSCSVYACGTCRVRFGELEVMQTHYKCDWHRYNLKRKVAELPPVTADNFAEIVKSYQKETEKTQTFRIAGDSTDLNQTGKLYCKVCSKSFLNPGSYSAHNISKKHLEREQNHTEGIQADGKKTMEVEADCQLAGKKKLEIVNNSEEDEWEDEDSDIPPYDITICLFCSKKNTSLDMNFQHMSSVHSCFIPDFEFCSDPAGLVDYLGKKVTDGHMCLYCNQRFQDTTATQRHMESKGHTKLGYENEFLLEYEDFFNFDDENEDNSNNEETGEDVGIIDESGYEMILPSGAVIGHRDLQRYYKQSLRPVKDVTLIKNISSHYKALGWKSHDESKSYALNMIKELNRLRQKSRLSVGLQANRINMKHYRRQYGF